MCNATHFISMLAWYELIMSTWTHLSTAKQRLMLRNDFATLLINATALRLHSWSLFQITLGLHAGVETSCHISVLYYQITLTGVLWKHRNLTRTETEVKTQRTGECLSWSTLRIDLFVLNGTRQNDCLLPEALSALWRGFQAAELKSQPEFVFGP